jgi:Long-chain acyl-CoA synthetases (AMP-forming)
LPPYHMFEVTTGFLTPLFYGGAICFSKDKNFKNVFSKYTPSALMVVPSILDGFYKQMLIGQGKKHKYIMSLIFISKLLLLVNIDTRGCLFKKIQKAFGGKLKMMVCGGAEVKDEVVKLFDDFGINVLVGYGITECSPIVSCNRSDMKRRGSVGIVVPEKFCEVHILNNEVLVKGTIVFSGYYNNQEATINSFDKGWFRTGDLGYFDKQGFLYIIGRTKNLIVLPDGNKVSPEEIENEFLKSQIVDSILVYEEKVKKGTQLIAAIYPNISNFEKDEIDVLEALNTLKDSINKNNPAYKRISRINVLSAPFETTALGKIKRYKYP